MNAQPISKILYILSIHVNNEPKSTVNTGKVVFAATHPVDAGHIKVWSSPTKGAGNLILDTTTGGDDWKKNGHWDHYSI